MDDTLIFYLQSIKLISLKPTDLHPDNPLTTLPHISLSLVVSDTKENELAPYILSMMCYVQQQLSLFPYIQTPDTLQRNIVELSKLEIDNPKISFESIPNFRENYILVANNLPKTFLLYGIHAYEPEYGPVTITLTNGNKIDLGCTIHIRAGILPQTMIGIRPMPFNFQTIPTFQSQPMPFNPQTIPTDQSQPMSVGNLIINNTLYNIVPASSSNNTTPDSVALRELWNNTATMRQRTMDDIKL